MRKYEQNQILELVATLNEATAEFKRLLALPEPEAAIQILANCQEDAVQLGSYIEQIEGEGTKTVGHLEDYCDLLYEISTELSHAGQDVVKRLRKQLIKIENSVRLELKPNKTEMVFFPYKASMWDALESVWLAARNDPQCDVYVVPIPYYDRLPGGAFGQMHYEGDLYPAHVSVTHWAEYDLEARHPDVVFIHNPYDEVNIVTSVPPAYYAKRLKVHTDLLCYIPYFAVAGDVPEHFCALPGVLHADRVFVQSKRIRNTYIRVLKEFEKVNGRVGSFGKAEEKITVAGSPKFDKALHAKPEEYALPPEWNALIERADGTRKKIVFYNASIGAILQGDAQYIKKLRFVLNAFRKRTDIVLWWRPHPLNAATYEAMRPQLREDYETIVAEYRQEGWGIYDDTADPHCAVACSDAYYGDMSSLTALYLCTDKPAMVQNALTTEAGATLGVGHLFHDGTYLWSTAFNFNGVFRIDPRNWAVEYMGSVPSELFRLDRPYSGMVQHGGKLYFAPGIARQAAVYDMQSNTFEKIGPVDLFATHHDTMRKFSAAYAYQSYVFFAGVSDPVIVKYDTETGAFTHYDNWREELAKLPVNQEQVFFLMGCTVGSKLILPVGRARAILVFDMETCAGQIVPIGSGVGGYSAACFDGQEVWLAPRYDSKVSAWNPQTGSCREIHSEGLEPLPEGYVYYASIVYAGGMVWVLPWSAGKALKIDAQSGAVCTAEEIQPDYGAWDATDPYPMYYWWNAIAVDGVIYARDGVSNALVTYDTHTKQRQEHFLVLPESAEEAIWPLADESLAQEAGCRDTLEKCCYFEATYYNLLNYYVDNLDAYLNQVVQKPESAFARAVSKQAVQCFQDENARTDGTAGEWIYKVSSAGGIGDGARRKG